MRKLLVSVWISLLASMVSFAQEVTVRGKVTDENGEPVIGATIVRKANPSIGTVTDLDGSYSLNLPDTGIHVLVASFVGYKPVEITVYPGNAKVLVKNVHLIPQSVEINVVTIEARANRAGDTYMEKIKVRSAVTLDYVSSETMKKTGDANIVAAVARVPGVSTNSGFITVRGIGDRYVKTTVNGSRIPTLDPFTNNIKLDIFPASLVDNIVISKTASPDLPGDWAGAYLSVETKDYPDQLSVVVETSFGYNSQATFKEVISSRQSPTDWLGYDNNFRSYNHRAYAQVNIAPVYFQEYVALGLGNYFAAMGVTASTPWNETYTKLGLVELGLLAKGQFNDANAIAAAKKAYKESYKKSAFGIINSDAAKANQAFPNNWNIIKRKVPVNFSQGFSIGNQTSFLHKPLGVMAGFRYGRSVRYDPGSVIARTNDSVSANGKVARRSFMEQEITRETNGWSALINLAYKYSPNHSLSLLFMPNLTGVNNIRNAIDSTSAGVPVGYSQSITKSQFYEERRQLVYQLKSEHFIPGPKLRIEGNASYTRGKSNAPDFKNLKYFADENLNYVFDLTESDPRRNYRYLLENMLDARLRMEIPVGDTLGLVRKIITGGAYQRSTREFNQYDYVVAFNGELGINNGNIEEVFSTDKFGIDNMKFYYEDYGNPANHTIGASEIMAGFAMLDYAVNSSLRFSGGLRVEKAYIFTDVFEYDSLGYPANDTRRKGPNQPFIPNPAQLNAVGFLPSMNVIYKLKEDALSPVNLRLNYSRTIARPSIREYSEAIVNDYELNAYVFGNTELRPVQIHNFDIRLESYSKSGDHISASIFYKHLKDHIELTSSNIGFSWTNVDQSYVGGIEVEGRKALNKNFGFRANVTFANSRTTVIEKILHINNDIKTYIPVDTVQHPLFGQAPFVINGMLTYKADSIGLSATVGYNVQGPRLVLSSVTGAPDIYELPRHLLDFKIAKSAGKRFTVSFTVRDMLNTPVRRSYHFREGWDILDFDRYTYGTDYTLGISYKL